MGISYQLPILYKAKTENFKYLLILEELNFCIREKLKQKKNVAP